MLNLLINGFFVSIFDPDITSHKSSEVGKWHLVVDLSSPVGECCGAQTMFPELFTIG